MEKISIHMWMPEKAKHYMESLNAFFAGHLAALRWADEGKQAQTSCSSCTSAAGHEECAGRNTASPGCSLHTAPQLPQDKQLSPASCQEPDLIKPLALQCYSKGCFCLYMLWVPPSITNSQLLQDLGQRNPWILLCHCICWLVKPMWPEDLMDKEVDTSEAAENGHLWFLNILPHLSLNALI